MAEKLRKIIDPFPMMGAGYFRARRSAGLSFSNAAKHLGITEGHLADIEDGNVAPNRLLLMRMREIYKVTFVREK
ncbi:MAG: helix-turn-helix transcriptional regulator [Myxococcales bacterium]|nr:helix-turn-helix transcriptional regulator [Myxococcales bacterium]